MHFDMKHATILRLWCRSEPRHPLTLAHSDFPPACHKNTCTVDYYVALTNYFEPDQLCYTQCVHLLFVYRTLQRVGKKSQLLDIVDPT